MKAKTYRVRAELADIAAQKMINYITEKQEAISEAEIINIAIKRGLENLTVKDIEAEKAQK